MDSSPPSPLPRSLASSNWRVKESSQESTPPTSNSPSSTSSARRYAPYSTIPRTPTSAFRLKDDPQPYHPSPSRPCPPKTPTQRPHDPSYPTTTRLHVGNLLYSVQPHTLIHFFHSFGFDKVNVCMSIDPFSGRNPSYAFVDFENAEAASRAMSELDGKEIGGRPVRVRNGQPKREGNGVRGCNVRNWNGGLKGKDGVLLSEDTKPAPVFDRWTQASSAPDHWFGQSMEGKRIYVGGLPRIDNYATLEAEVRKLFSDYKIVAISRLISPDKVKRQIAGNHYYIFIDMESDEEAGRAVAGMNKTEAWWGGQLKVARARKGADSNRVLKEQKYYGDASEETSDSERGKEKEKLMARMQDWRSGGLLKSVESDGNGKNGEVVEGILIDLGD